MIVRNAIQRSSFVVAEVLSYGVMAIAPLQQRLPSDRSYIHTDGDRLLRLRVSHRMGPSPESKGDICAILSPVFCI